MSLYETWISKAYDKEGRSIKKFWDGYIPKEQKIYEAILADKKAGFSANIKRLSEKYDMDPMMIVGFVDGINEATEKPLSLDELKELDEGSDVSMEIDFKKLYQKMVEFKAEHLYSLPQWSDIFDDNTRAFLFKEQKSSGTFMREGLKTGRNDPCPCGSGKKYKKCCGA